MEELSTGLELEEPSLTSLPLDCAAALTLPFVVHGCTGSSTQLKDGGEKGGEGRPGAKFESLQTTLGTHRWPLSSI